MARMSQESVTVALRSPERKSAPVNGTTPPDDENAMFERLDDYIRGFDRND
jgi:hypothetical protein